MTHNLHRRLIRSAPYTFDILSHTSRPVLLSCLRLFSQIRSSINTAAGCVIYTAFKKKTRDKFAANLMLQIWEPGLIFGLGRHGRTH